MDVFDATYKGIGDLFISNEQKKLNESMLQDAELRRQQDEALLEILSTKRAMYSGDSSSDATTMYILGGAAILMVFVILMI